MQSVYEIVTAAVVQSTSLSRHSVATIVVAFEHGFGDCERVPLGKREDLDKASEYIFEYIFTI